MLLKDMTTAEIAAENERRKALTAGRYDPVSGHGACGDREADTSPVDGTICMVPHSMLADAAYAAARTNAESWQKLRFRHDFEYWAVTAVRIRDKLSGHEVPFRLNRPQRMVLEVLEKQRMAGKPLRIIILKARQWGGSTLVQMYMAWIQSVLRENWHSLICAHVKDSAATIRGMYTRMLDNYPRNLWINAASETDNETNAPRFRPFERSLNTREIVGRGCRVTIGSSENQEAVRGADFAMAHLSEAAFWGDSSRRNPEDFIRAVCSGIMLEPLTLIAVESTANGTGNWFHREWLRAEKGLSDKAPIFIPWYEIDIYSQALATTDIAAFVDEMTEYEENLWHTVPHITLEKLLWYHRKAREYPLQSQMHAEFPSTPVEAFSATGRGVFDLTAVNRLRLQCPEPQELARGEICGGRFVHDRNGKLLVLPAALTPHNGEKMLNRYVAGVDVGGRSEGSDRTVIAVLDRLGHNGDGVPEFVAQWTGHCDYDILVHKAADIARFFDNALLVIESNTLEQADAVSGLGILKLIAAEYSNIYRRRATDELTDRPTQKIGFHTNRATKLMLVTGLQSDIREGAFHDNFRDAVDEFATYEEPRQGVFAAKPGCHDDMLMARAIALAVARQLPTPRPQSDLALPPLQWHF